MHEYTHAMHGHSLKREILLDEAKQINQALLNDPQIRLEDSQKIQLLFQGYPASSEYTMLTAALEKTADTFVTCIDGQAAKNAALYTEINGYQKNNNDMNVIHANWQTSQVITSSQQLKNLIAQKLSLFPKFSAPQAGA